MRAVGLIRWEGIEGRFDRRIAEQLGEMGASVGKMDLGDLKGIGGWRRSITGRSHGNMRRFEESESLLCALIAGSGKGQVFGEGLIICEDRREYVG